jgi:hypothetical protein
MPFRRLPDTDATRTQALNAAYKKLAASSASESLISTATFNALQALMPQWEQEVAERAAALGNQTAATSALIAAAATLRTHVGHFFQVFQLGVGRGIFSPSGRAVYELSVNEETVPDLCSEANLLLWADRIVKGDPRRVAQFSERPMDLPSAYDVATCLDAYNTQLARQTTAKDTLEAEQADVTELRAKADEVIRDVWDEVEFALRQQEPPALRRRAREWGVFYALRAGEPEEVVVAPEVG